MSDPSYSFEIFAPHNEDGWKRLRSTLPFLVAAKPSMITVTYVGIGAAARLRTLKTAMFLNEELPREIKVGVHVSRTGSDLEGIRRLVDNLPFNATDVVTIGGDNRPKKGETRYDNALLYPYTDAMIADIHERRPDLRISVGVNPGNPDIADELENLGRKIEAGAGRAYSQYERNFDYAKFLQFVEATRNANMEIPIVPGLMSFSELAPNRIKDAQRVPVGLRVVSAYRDAREFAKRHGLHEPTIINMVHRAASATQLVNLAGHGVFECHFFTLNKADCIDTIAAVHPKLAKTWMLKNGMSVADARGYNIA